MKTAILDSNESDLASWFTPTGESPEWVDVLAGETGTISVTRKRPNRSARPGPEQILASPWRSTSAESTSAGTNSIRRGSAGPRTGPEHPAPPDARPRRPDGLSDSDVPALPNESELPAPPKESAGSSGSQDSNPTG